MNILEFVLWPDRAAVEVIWRLSGFDIGRVVIDNTLPGRLPYTAWSTAKGQWLGSTTPGHLMAACNIIVRTMT
jgi:hypothetical protein